MSTQKLKKTKPFSTKTGDYFSVLLSLWLPRYGWTVTVPTAVCAAVGVIVDKRMLLVTLMLLFIIVPTLMSVLYTHYLLTPEAYRTVLRKEAEISYGDYIRLVYLPNENDEEAQDRSERMKLKSRDDKPEEKPKPVALPKPETIPWSDVISVRHTSRFMVYLLRGARLNFLLIPHSAFLCDEDDKS